MKTLSIYQILITTDTVSIALKQKTKNHFLFQKTSMALHTIKN